MIDFSLTEEEQLAQRAARDFAERRLRPALRKHEAEGVPPALAEEFRALSIGSADVPVELGGAGLGPLAQALVLEELGAADVASAIALDGLGPARYPMLTLGEGGKRSAVLDERAALVVEGDGPLSLGEDGTLHGSVPWSLGADPSAIVVLLSSAACVVDAASVAGERVHPIALQAAGAAALRFDRVRPREVLRGDPSAARAGIALYQSALLVGLSRAAYEYTARYGRERVTFGRPLVQHQALAFLIVEMAMAVDAARLATWRAAWEIGRKSREAPAAAAMAREEASECALMATDRAVQLLGGHGYLKDHPVEKWMREARALTLAWGASAGHV